jgi:high-affinity Fe2+/Pb2+ permease
MALRTPRTFDEWIGAITTVLLAAYFALVLYLLASPSSDPQRVMAEGFFTFVALVLLLLGGLLWLGMARKHPWLVRTIFVIAMLPLLDTIAIQIFLPAQSSR